MFSTTLKRVIVLYCILSHSQSIVEFVTEVISEMTVRAAMDDIGMVTSEKAYEQIRRIEIAFACRFSIVEERTTRAMGLGVIHCRITARAKTFLLESRIPNVKRAKSHAMPMAGMITICHNMILDIMSLPLKNRNCLMVSADAKLVPRTIKMAGKYPLDIVDVACVSG